MLQENPLNFAVRISSAVTQEKITELPIEAPHPDDVVDITTFIH